MPYHLAMIFQHCHQGYMVTPEKLPECLQNKSSYTVAEFYDILDIITKFFKKEMYVERVTHSVGYDVVRVSSKCFKNSLLFT